MYVNYPLNRDYRFVKTMNTKNKLLKFATCNLTFKKSLCSDMHYPTPDIWAKFEFNRPVVIGQLRSKDISTDDGQTDGRTDIVSEDIK